MKSSFICEKCAGTMYEQFSQTQVRCVTCNQVSTFDTGFKLKKEFELITDTALLDIIEKQTLVKATYTKRFINYTIDLICIIFIMVFIISMLNTYGQTFSLTENDIIRILFILIFPSYYFLLEYKFGKTIGKYFTKTKVVSSDGSELTFGQCVGRAFCRIIPFEYISGFFSEGVFWHDSIPNTLVVEDN